MNQNPNEELTVSLTRLELETLLQTLANNVVYAQSAPLIHKIQIQVQTKKAAEAEPEFDLKSVK